MALKESNLKTKYMEQEFFSKFSINEEVCFYPMYRHQIEMGIDAESLEGKIVAVRFTEAKVFYDVYNNYWGKVFDNVSSEKVTTSTPVNMLQQA